MRRLLGKILESGDSFTGTYADVFGDTDVSPNAEPWIVRLADHYVTNYMAGGRLNEEYSYRYVECDMGMEIEERFTWGGMLRRAMHEAGDPGPVVSCSVADADLSTRHHDVSPHFSAWTATRVYFPLKYDGGLWVGSAPRDPSDEHVYPMGGG